MAADTLYHARIPAELRSVTTEFPIAEHKSLGAQKRRKRSTRSDDGDGEDDKESQVRRYRISLAKAMRQSKRDAVLESRRRVLQSLNWVVWLTDDDDDGDDEVDGATVGGGHEDMETMEQAPVQQHTPQPSTPVRSHFQFPSPQQWASSPQHQHRAKWASWSPHSPAPQASELVLPVLPDFEEPAQSVEIWPGDEQWITQPMN